MTGIEVASTVATPLALLLGVAALAVLWRHSRLPGVDWGHIAAGLMFFLAGLAMSVWSMAVAGDPRIGGFLADLFLAWSAIFNVIGAALIIEGAFRNAYDLVIEG